MLSVKNLHVTVGGKEILKGLDLEVGAGEVHAIMGPNGSGKSTLAYALAGREGYDATAGGITYKGKDLLALKPEERAGEGIFLAFQYPVEIPGVANLTFLRNALNALRAYRGEKPLDAVGFIKLARDRGKAFGMDDKLLRRAVNVGFSGGEKKRNEVFQMAVLDPTLAILDETDSGLDVDALRIVAEGVNRMRGPDRAMIVVTHYERLLDFIVPDKVHVLAAGRIVKTGGPELAKEIERTGYATLGTAA